MSDIRQETLATTAIKANVSVSVHCGQEVDRGLRGEEVSLTRKFALKIGFSAHYHRSQLMTVTLD
jgi:hypothetical protein